MLKKPTQEHIIVFLTVMIFVLFGLFLHGFLSVRNLLIMARSISVLGILGCGMAIVIVARGLDLSQVATMVASSALIVKLLQHGLSMPVALLLGLALAVFVGTLNGYVIGFIEVPALFMTLASGLIVVGFVRGWILKGEVFITLPATGQFLLKLGQGQLMGIVPVPIVIFLMVALFAHQFLSKTLYGLFIYAHGDNPETASFTGIGVRPLLILEYILCGVMGYIAGVVSVGTVGVSDVRLASSPLIFEVILVVVLGGVSLFGGRGSIWSVLAGTALIGVVFNGMTIMNIQSNVQAIIEGLVLLCAIIIDIRLHPRDEETVRQGDI